MADREVSLKFRVSDDGTLSVFDTAEQKLRKLERTANDVSQSSSDALVGMLAETRRMLGELDAKTASLSASSVGGFGRISGAIGGLNLALAGAAAGVALLGAGVAGVVRQQFATVDEISRVARQAGTAVEDLSQLRVAARLSHLSIDDLGGGLGALSKSLVDAQGGARRTVNTFDALKVSFEGSDKLIRNNIDVVEDLAEVFSQLPDGPQKTAAALELFGGAGDRWIGLLNRGRAGIRELIAENERLGLSFDRTFADKVETVNSNLARIGLAAEGLALSFAERVAPAIATASERLVEFLGISARGTSLESVRRQILEREELIKSIDSFESGGLGAAFASPGLALSGSTARQQQRADAETELATLRAQFQGILRDEYDRSRSGGVLSADEINARLRALGLVGQRPARDDSAENRREEREAARLARIEFEASVIAQERSNKLAAQRVKFLEEDLGIARSRADTDKELLAIQGDLYAIAQEIDATQVSILERKRNILLEEIAFADAQKDGAATAEKLRTDLALVNAELARGPDAVAALTRELEKAKKTTETISIDFGDAFRRLTTGGGDFGNIGDIAVNAFQAAGADAVDAFLGEKLKLDFEVEKNFGQDLPGYLSDGVNNMVDVFSDGVSDLASLAQSGAARIGQFFGRGFDDVAADGQALAQQLDGLGVPTFGGAPTSGPSTSAIPQSTALPSNTLVNVPGIGFVTQGELDQIRQQNPGALNRAGVANSSALGVLAIAGVVTPIIDNLLERNAQVRTPVGSFDLGNDSNIGFGAAVGGGALLGAGIGSILPGVGTAVGAAVGAIVGAVVGIIDEIFGRGFKSTGDIGGEIINEVASRNRFILQQRQIEASGRTGIDADIIFGTPSFRAPFFTEQGFPIPGNETLAKPGAYIENILDQFINPALGTERTVIGPNGERITLPPGYGIVGNRVQQIIGDQFKPVSPEVEAAVRGPALGLGALLGLGNANFTVEQANRIANNVLLSGVEFPEEAKRQVKLLAEAAGFDLRSGIEQLAVDFTKVGVLGDDLPPGDIRRDQFAVAVREVVNLFEDEVPAGVDVLEIAMRNVGETSVNTGKLLEELDREIEIFGDLADSLGTTLRGSLGAALLQPTGASVLAGGGSLQDVVRAVGRQGSAFTSQLQTGIRDSVSVAISEGVFDAVEATPAWQALTKQIADAVSDPSLFATIPQLLGDVYSASVPIINAAQVGARGFFDAFAVTPETLYGQADAFRGRAEDLRFGRLTAERQVASIDKQIAKAERDLIRGYQTGDINLLTGALTTLGTLGEQRAGLADALIPGGGVANERQRESFFNESLRYVDFAAKGLEKAGQFQQDAITGNTDAQKENTAAAGTLTEATTSLTDEIITLQDIIRAVGRGDIPQAVIAQAVARMVLDDRVSRNEFEKAMSGARG